VFPDAQPLFTLANRAKMLHAIVAPSVLASDFGQLTAECKRMIKGGADWMHMGSTLPYFLSYLG
jgi:hypothetical protein